MAKILINNGMIVTPGEIFRGAILVEDNKIAGVRRYQKTTDIEGSPSLELKMWKSESPHISEAEVMDANGNFVIPGLIDLHGDALEKALQPRKRTLFPIPLALRSLQASLLAGGVTTMFHGISFVGEEGLRSNEMGSSIVKEIIHLQQGKDALLHHKIHVRYELINDKGCEGICKMIEDGSVDLLSIMDHTPQYGKYRNLDEYRYYVEKTHNLTGEACDRFIEQQRAKRDAIDFTAEQRLISCALEHHIPVSSHDDDTVDKVEQLREKGVSISEFPLNELAAKYAMDVNMFVVVGGPNVLRGFSHENNLSARHALKSGLANLICSDYYPFSMLASVFVLFDEGMDLHQAVAYASLIPARAAGLADQWGSIEIGKRADLLLIRHEPGETPMVNRAMIDGKWALIHEL